MDEPMTATMVNRSRELARRRELAMADNRASLPRPPHYAGQNPHSKLPSWMRPILDMLLTGEGIIRR